MAVVSFFWSECRSTCTSGSSDRVRSWDESLGNGSGARGLAVRARWAMRGGARLMAVSAFWCSIATDEISLLLAVAVFGLGGPIISTGAPKVVSAWFESRQRGLAMGIYVTGPGIGAIVGLLLTNAVLLPALDNDWRQVLRLWGFFTLITALAWFVISCRLTMAPSHLRKLQTIDLGLLPLLRHPVVRLLLLMSIGVFAINHGIGNWLPELLRASGRTMLKPATSRH